MATNSRELRMLAVLAMFLSVGLSLSAKDSKTEGLPNVVFMMADDFGYGDVGYNNGPAETPNLDAMSTGPNTITLTRYYSGGPVCSPTRGTVLTGRNHNRYCIWSANIGGSRIVTPQKMPLPPTEITIPELLKPLGYRTAVFGKWHLGDVKAIPGGNKKWNVSHPGMHGFNDWLVTERSAQNLNPNCACFNETKHLCVLGHYTIPPPCYKYYTIPNKQSGVPETLSEPIFGDDSHYLVDIFADFLNKTVSEKKPFFIYLPFHAVHNRYITSPDYVERYKDKQYTQDQLDYYTTISAMDDAVGRVRELLKQFNVSDNTMLWFTSDNGPKPTPGRTDGLRGWKSKLYEGGIRVPGMIEWPAVIKKNVHSAYPVISSDLLPTLCDIMGIPPPTDRPIDGVSVYPMIKGEAKTRNSSIKWAFNIKDNFRGLYNAAISDDRFKVFAQYASGRMVFAQLYDLVEDPGESTDVSRAYPDKFKALKKELEDWRMSVYASAKDEVQCLGLFSEQK